MLKAVVLIRVITEKGLKIIEKGRVIFIAKRFGNFLR